MPEETIAAKVTEEKKTEVRVAAAKRNIDMSTWLREAIDEKLEREAREGNPRVGAVAAGSYR